VKRVTFVELSVFERITPLASGYLQAYAAADPGLAADYQFTTCTTSIKTAPERIAKDVLATDGDVYALSCYVWNMGLMRPLLRTLRAARPRAQIILGGPQVMQHAASYLDPADERVAVCNGEGEATFADYLRELTESRPDLSRVEGLSVCRDGQVLTAPQRPRISDLDTIPSPFLTGVIEASYSMSILETNRGCPYHCGFCYWGAATNDRVYRFDEERVREDISWMARSGIVFLYIADANWGMLRQDVELSRHIARCAREEGLPNVVYFSAAKNKPQAVTRITEIFQDGGLIASQPVSMQTLAPESLSVIARSNIKLDAFAAVQEDLREKGISSFIELIWPLPGETLDSFRGGIGTLCDKDAQTVIAYPHLLLHNTPLYQRREELGLVTRPAGGGVAEAQIVVRTREVDAEEFAAGMRFFYAVHALHNTRSLRAVARHLVRRGVLSYAELFSAFAEHWRARPAGDPIVEFVERSIRDAEYYDIGNYGLFIHTVLHGSRRLFDRQLREFVRSQPWWSDGAVRALFEIDLVNRPYVYSSTPLDDLDYPFEELRVLDLEPRGYRVELDRRWLGSLRDSVRLEAGPRPGTTFVVDHQRMQYPFMATQSMDHNANYCHGMIEKVENIVPVWRAL
jgi:radical SAM superfamily enzyme YgiQ (UPF0313 family)